MLQTCTTEENKVYWDGSSRASKTRACSGCLSTSQQSDWRWGSLIHISYINKTCLSSANALLGGIAAPGISICSLHAWCSSVLAQWLVRCHSLFLVLLGWPCWTCDYPNPCSSTKFSMGVCRADSAVFSWVTFMSILSCLHIRASFSHSLLRERDTWYI